MAEGTLTILGATGYSGRLCAAEAVRQGLSVRLAGRRRDALEALAHELGADAVAVVDIADGASLDVLARSSDVLLSCAGPYDRVGRPVVEAALAARTPYADISGEVGFLRWVYDQDDRAAAAGVAFVPGVGFDGVGELGAVLAARRLPAGAAIDEARVAYATRNIRVSRGTARSALGVVRGGVLRYRAAQVVREPAGAHAFQEVFPPPFGRCSVASAPLPEGLTLGRSLQARDALAYIAVPLGALLPPIAGPLSALAAAAGRTPLWSALGRVVDLLPEGPPDGRRGASHAAVVATVVRGEHSARAALRLSDIYGTTARVATAYARRLLDGSVKPGVQTPAQAVDDPETVLADIGAAFSY